ncbi:hypothetical protein BHE74_00027758 [Ensete ventricosum]|nr:hypothetical protein BHE74_00027758 [Ensete ventricosum]
MPQCCHSGCHEESGLTQEWVGEGELPRERTQSEVAEALRCQNDWRFGLLQCSHSLGARQVRGQDRDDEGHAWELQSVFPSTKGNCSENTGVLQQTVDKGEEATTSPEGLSNPKAKHWSERRWTRRNATMPQRQIYRSRRKRCKCNAMDSRAMGLAAPWYHKGRIFVESSIPCSRGGRTLVVKGAEEMENAETNSKYQDKAEGHRPRNFIRPTSTGFLSPKKMGETEYPSSLIYFAEELCTSLKTLQRNLIKDELSNPHKGDQYY